jgi:hypothetical protein
LQVGLAVAVLGLVAEVLVVIVAAFQVKVAEAEEVPRVQSK